MPPKGSVALAIALALGAGAAPLGVAPAEIRVGATGDGTKLAPAPPLPGASRAWDPLTRTVRLEGALGETVAFQLVLDGGREGLREVRVERGELRGAERRIGASAVEAFLVGYLRVTGTPESKIVTGGPGEYADPLIPLEDPDAPGRDVAQPFAVPPGRLQPVWVDVAIPSEVVAGTYEGTLRVSAAGQPPLRVAVRLVVWGFRLPETSHLAAWIPLYTGRLLRGERAGPEALADLVGRYARMARAHRFVTQLYEAQPRAEWDWEQGRLLAVDWTEYDRIHGPVLDGRIGPVPRPWMAPLSEEWVGFRLPAATRPPTSVLSRALEAYAREIVRHYDARGWPLEPAFVYPVDEPTTRRDPVVFAKLRAYAEAVRAGSGRRLQFLVTSGPEIGSPAEAGKQDLRELVDVWAMPGYAYVPGVMQSYQARGRQAWFYQYHPPFVGGQNVTDDGLAFRTWPWIAWKYRVDGVYLWCGNFWNQDPYRDPRNWRGLHGNGVFFYPGGALADLGLPSVAGPVSSFRMKALRRGMQDFEYLWLARSRGRGAEAGRIVDSVVRRALNDRGYVPHWRHPLWAQQGDWSQDVEEWERARADLAALILGTARRGHDGGA